LDANTRRCDPPLPVNEVQTIAASVGRYRPGHDPHGDTLGLTDMGNSSRFVQRFRNTLRFCWEWSRWLLWTGYRWERVHAGTAIAMARDVVRDLYGLAQSAISPDDRKRFAQHAIASESQRRLEAMVSLARSEKPIPVTPEELDSHPWLLCTPTVTVDLRTGDTHPPRPDDLHTLSTGTQYDPDATCPRWMDFLDTTFGMDEALKDYIHRMAGYALVGLQREQVFMLFHGRGANGKSTLLRTLAAVIGDYAKSVSPATLLAKSRDATALSEMASLRGARFVHASEFPRGKTIDAELLKRLTGGDPVNARLLYAEVFTFTPVATVVFSSNDMPRVTDASHAFWRRAKCIPFVNVIPEAEQDPDLVDKLLAEAPGILAWCVRGCMEWQKRPLSVDVPASVRDATRAYRTAEDRLAEFVEDHCTIEAGAFTATADLYREYLRWSESEGEKPQSKTGVVRALQTAFPGVDSDKQRGQRGLSGIRLND